MKTSPTYLISSSLLLTQSKKRTERSPSHSSSHCNSNDSTSFSFPFGRVLAAPASSTSSDIAFRSTKTLAKEPFRLFAHVRMEHLVAGMSGGVASTLILHPLDLVKIRFAVNDGLGSRPKYDGLLHAFKSILKDEGVRGLYR